MSSLYSTLGLSIDASTREIRTAFKRNALLLHPDKGGTKEAFQTALLAFETLSDPVARERYDRRLLKSRCCAQKARRKENTRKRQPQPTTSFVSKRPRKESAGRGKRKRTSDSKRKSESKATDTFSGQPEPSSNSSTYYASIENNGSVGPKAPPRHIKDLRHITVRIFDVLQRVPASQRRVLLEQQFTHVQRVAFEASILEARRAGTFSRSSTPGGATEYHDLSTSLKLDHQAECSSSSSKDSDDSEDCCKQWCAVEDASTGDISEDGEADCVSGDAPEHGEDFWDKYDLLRDVSQFMLGHGNEGAPAAEPSYEASSMQGHSIRSPIDDPAGGLQHGGDHTAAPVRTRGMSTRKKGKVTWYIANVALGNMLIETRRSTDLSVALDSLVTLTEVKQRALASPSCSLEDSFLDSMASVLSEHGTTLERLGVTFRVSVTMKWWWFPKRRLFSPRIRNVNLALKAQREFHPFSAHLCGRIVIPERWRRLRGFEVEWPAFYSAFVGIYAACGQETKGVNVLTSLKKIADRSREHEAMLAEDRLAQGIKRWSRECQAAVDRARRQAERNVRKLERMNQKWLAREDKLSRRFNNVSHSFEMRVRRLVQLWWKAKLKHDVQQQRQASAAAKQEYRQTSAAAARRKRQAYVAANVTNRNARKKERLAARAAAAAQRAFRKERFNRTRWRNDITMEDILRAHK